MHVVSFASQSYRRRMQSFLHDQKMGEKVSFAVQEVIHAVQKNGNKAIIDFTKRWDGCHLRPRDLRVDQELLTNSLKQLKPDSRRAIRQASENIRHFHRQTLPKAWSGKNSHGATVGENFYPIDRVGLYIPGGSVPLVSTVLMTVIPAQVAGVPSIAVVTPPNREGQVSPDLLAALHYLGINEVYRVGGAQAVAGLAFGTKTIQAVDKIAGPGNAYVMEAKRQIFGTAGIDLLPGPSEVMVIADEGANPEWVAADLLAQAEHGSGKEKVCAVVFGESFAKKIETECYQQMETLTHSKAVSDVLQKRTLIVTVQSPEEAAEVANTMAPEHLELQTDLPLARKLTKLITRAGAILQGYYTPTVLGDFVAGPSHTLPTNTAARFSSGLQVSDFMRRSSIVRYDRSSASRAVETVKQFSRMEKLDAHGRSLSLRLAKKS